MAKLAFSKLKLTQNKDIKITSIGDNEVEVKQYLPINEKLELIGNVINQAADENNFSNPIKLEMFMCLEILFYYTNISFTDKQKEDLVKLYDILESNGIFDIIFDVIPEEEMTTIVDGVFDCSDAIYTYRNSVLGLLDTIKNDYEGLNLDVENLTNDIKDPEVLKLLKFVADKGNIV